MDYIGLIRSFLAVCIVISQITGTQIACGDQQGLLLQKKEVPLISFMNMSPPYEGYDYFQHIEKFKFKFQATAFSLTNAWWLAEISTLVFSNEKFVRSHLKKAGLTTVLFFDKQSTQCYIASNDKFAVIAFRGSEIWAKRDNFDIDNAFADLKADIDIRLTEWSNGGKVHRGFKSAMDEVWPELLPHIERLINQDCRIWITGHSLGGALATLCGSLVANAQGVYTFGSPRVGNEEFKVNLSGKHYRIVNNADIVCRVPPKYKYVHVGTLKFIDNYGIIGDVMGQYLQPIDEPDDVPVGQEIASHTGKNDFKGFVPAPFRDHVPVLYAVHLWNSLIESEKEGQQ